MYWERLFLPKTSPYLSQFIKVRFGNSSDEYMVPEDCILVYRKLSRHLNDTSTSDVLNLQEADSQVGHTFIHFLYSGTYQFLGQHALSPMDTRDKEFEQGILVYSAAIKYDIPQLAELAKDQVYKASADLPLASVIRNARKLFDSLPRGDKLLLDLIKSLMEERLEKDADTFLTVNFFEGFGKHETLDPHLFRFIVEIYEKKLFHLTEKTQETTEKNEEEPVHENGVSAEIPGQAPDPGAWDEFPGSNDLEVEHRAESSLPIESATDNLPVEEYPPPPDAFTTVESQAEYQLQKKAPPRLILQLLKPPVVSSTTLS
ncbi:hypothetical protein PISL3812_06297 [Talaromyces islandicus]|uniref:BTB domain-containing protein n=1 Tax=Talaromyces islandicus TaxID=28573 RepID=A0A0U1M2Q3_TALIS|nr:hypothetical protein PISL3812_06297 [Talaromyces islandicus]